MAIKAVKCAGELATRTKVNDLVNDFTGSVLGVKPPFASAKSEESEYIYPFVFKCYGCGKGLVNGTRSIFAAGQAYVSAPACATGVGCAAPAVSAGRAALLAVRGSVRAGVSCTSMVKTGTENWEGYKARWAELAGFFEEAKAQGFSTQRLVASFKSLPGDLDAWKNDRKQNQIKEEKERVEKVVTHFKQAYSHLVKANSIKQNEVKPLKKQLGEMRLAEFERNFFKLSSCWAKVQKLGNSLSKEVGEGFEEMSEAVIELEAVQRSLERISGAKQEAMNRTKERWQQLKTRANTAHQNLLGVAYGAKATAKTTGEKLTSLAKQPGKLDRLRAEVVEVRQEAIGLVNTQVDAAMERFEKKHGGRIEEARNKVEEIEKKLKSAMVKIRKYRTQKVASN